MKYRCLLFDADNTLWDFNKSEKHALSATISTFGVPPAKTHLFTYHQINKQCWTDFENGLLSQERLRYRRFELFLEKLDQDQDPVSFGDHYLAGLAASDYMMRGARKLLEALKGKYRLTLITNGLKEVQRPRIRNTALEEYFDTIVISDEIGVAKPHHGFFDYTFEQMDQPDKEQVLVIGDSISSDIKGGNDYGLTTCWYNPDGRENPTEVRPGFEIRSLKELWKVLDK